MEMMTTIVAAAAASLGLAGAAGAAPGASSTHPGASSTGGTTASSTTTDDDASVTKTTEPDSAASQALREPPKMWFGFNTELSPAGSFSASSTAAGSQDNFGSQVAFGVGLNAEFDPIPLLGIAFAPRFLFNVVPNDSMDDAQTMLDLRVRALVGPHLGKLRLYGFADMGWALLFGDPNVDGPYSGLTVGFGAGAAFTMTRSMRMYLEASYELGFENHNDDYDGIGEHVNMFSLSLGAQLGVGG